MVFSYVGTIIDAKKASVFGGGTGYRPDSTRQPSSRLPEYLLGFSPWLAGYSVTRLARLSGLFLDYLGLRSVFRFRPGCFAGMSQ